ncbi:TolC family protein [Psychromonas sp.]|uniref:TolC family protein n=1 Tax=Psychromonas sp. TaxID=1884585 RepID=UPI003566A0D1
MVYSGQFKITLISLALLGIAGCSSGSGKQFQQAAEAAKAEQQNWQYTQSDAVQVKQITDLLAIPQLTSLIESALLQNPGLQQSAMALQIAYAQRGVTASDRIPQLSAGFTASNEEDSDSSYQGELSVSWELDLWHKIADGISALEMDSASTAATYQGARDLLAANIMRSWLEINLQQQLIGIEEQRLQVLENNEIIIRERYRSGLGELEELDTASSSSASTRATLADYREQLAQSKRTLWQLVGVSRQATELQVGSSFPDVLEPLAGLPEQDLGRRPDLQSAYYNIVAQQYRTDVAYKALLPSIDLSASLTDLASSPTDALFTSPAWGLLGQLTAPIFQGGELRSQIEIAELTTEQTYWAYQETLLNAVNEVENYLGQERSLEKQEQHLDDALSSAQRSFSNYQTKYRQGLVDILDLLSVQQQTFDLQSQLTETTYNRLINRIDLGLALGLGVSS